jgi:cell division septation protein DedD
MIVLATPAGAAMTSAEFDKLQASANSGNPDSAFRLGRAYKIGDDVPANLDKAEGWFERAVKLGNAKAGTELGLVLAQNGKGAAALPWLKAAAEKGDVRAQYALGTLLFGGQGVAVDAAQGRDWVKRAAKAGLPAAVEALAVMDKALAPPKTPAKPYQIISIDMKAPVAAKVVEAKPARTAGEKAQSQSRGAVWRAQLGTFAVAGNARRHWQAVKRSVPAGLHASFPVSGGFTRVLVGPFGGKDEAARFCAAQRQRDRDCLEVKTAGSG